MSEAAQARQPVLDCADADATRALVCEFGEELAGGGDECLANAASHTLRAPPR